MTTVASFCRNCGKALTEEEKAVPGTILCAGCAPATAAAPPASSVAAPTASAPAASVRSDAPSPGLAFLLGLIPGVGAIYNGQYAKGLIHVFIFGLLMSIADSGAGRGEIQPLLVMMTVGFYLYMPFEAYHTARRRALGMAVDEFSSVVPLNGGSLVGPSIMIVLGVIFLLNNLELLRLSQILRFWPALLIALGVYMLYVRMTESSSQPPQEEAHPQEVRQ